MIDLNVITIGEFIEDLITEIECKIKIERDNNSLISTGRIEAFNAILEFIATYK